MRNPSLKEPITKVAAIEYFTHLAGSFMAVVVEEKRWRTSHHAKYTVTQ